MIKTQSISVPIIYCQSEEIFYCIISVNWIGFFMKFGILSNYNTFRRILIFSRSDAETSTNLVNN